MSTLVNEARTLAEIEQDREADEAPPRSTRWYTLRGARADVDQSAQWTGPHERREETQQSTRRLRGDQSYPGLHLGRGTKWAKR